MICAHAYKIEIWHRGLVILFGWFLLLLVLGLVQNCMTLSRWFSHKTAAFYAEQCTSPSLFHNLFKSHEVVQTDHWTTIGSLLTIASDLSLTTHIDIICSKTKCILGLVYRRFYKHSDIKASHQLCESLVQPHFGICSCSMVSISTERHSHTRANPVLSMLPEFPLRTGMLVITTFWTYLSYLNLHNIKCTQGCALCMR